MHSVDSTKRFTNRVADYVRYRPSYPSAVLNWLRDALGVTADWRVVDLGAGTGISSKLFLDAGFTVTAVEPNQAMREAALAWLGGNPRFHAVPGRAEATGLPARSADLVAAAQAFHWFDPEAVRLEFRRILRPGGLAVVFWNSRLTAGTPFLEGYEALLRRYGADYERIAERYADDAKMRGWFGEEPGGGLRGTAHFEHHQFLDFDGLRGRLMSSSYAPRLGDPNHAPMLLALRELFDATEAGGKVDLEYDTRVYAGEMV